MRTSFEIWTALAGLAIFLLGMRFIEEALQKLSGRPFKLFLKKHTSNRVKAAVGGALVTGILQSSSIVNLMILALTGAGVIKMQNALAVLLGANLGSTVNGWLIATVGFRLSIESFAFAITGIAGLAMALFRRESRWYTSAKLLLGIGLLFVGLESIKNGMEGIVKQVDLVALARYPAILLFLAGIVITSLVQSSSATVAIVLSALHVQAISLFSATAIVLGSEIGTSIKLVLASGRGQVVKKRLAYGNLIFNIVSAFIVFLFLPAANTFITGIIGIKDNLTALVFFQSLVNISGIIVFLPLLNWFGKLLEKTFSDVATDTMFIQRVKVAETALALDALEKETKQFLVSVCQLALGAFGKPLPGPVGPMAGSDANARSAMMKYEYIKRVHGRLNDYCIQLGTKLTQPESVARLEQLVAAIRNAMYAAKSLKDAYPDIEHLRSSSNNVKYDYYRETGDMAGEFYTRLLNRIVDGKTESGFEELTGIYRSIQEKYAKSLQKLYKETGLKQLNELEFSTLVNFNREMYTSFKSAVFAAKDYVLDRKKAGFFDELPGFIR